MSRQDWSLNGDTEQSRKIFIYLFAYKLSMIKVA